MISHTVQAVSPWSHLLYLYCFNVSGTVSLSLAIDSARMVVGRSTMTARQSRTRCLMNLEMLTVLIVLNSS